MSEMVLPCLLVAIASGLLTEVVRRAALRLGRLDIPNERSSHVAPTPRGGGLAIVIALSAALLFLAWRGEVGGALLLPLLVGGCAVAGVGFVDDRRPLSPAIRLLVHLAAATLAVYTLGGLPALTLGAKTVDLGWVGHVMAVLGVVWILNLFNFMDGIDGIAGAEAVVVCASAALLFTVMGAPGASTQVAWLAAAGSAGFLILNWPPARIFMGDVGSGYLGYVIGVLALAGAHEHPAGIFAWLILGGAFVVDASVTLVRRLARGERVYEAHRCHAYQHLSRRWSSHLSVTLLVLAINVFWLAPWAAAALYKSAQAGWFALAALVPLVFAAVLAGAGSRESRVKS
jgi:Fuc2NAc and GlcNAc transferase